MIDDYDVMIRVCNYYSFNLRLWFVLIVILRRRCSIIRLTRTVMDVLNDKAVDDSTRGKSWIIIIIIHYVCIDASPIQRKLLYLIISDGVSVVAVKVTVILNIL